MKRESLERFREQLFRRVGYTVGLWDLLSFHRVCELLRGRGSRDRRELATLVRKELSLAKGDAEGKVDVARSLGLLFSVGSRLALSHNGRALVALVEINGPASAAVRAFFLKRVVDRDADISLTLLMALKSGGNTADDFIRGLESLLTLKRSIYASAVSLLSLKRELPRILTVRDSPTRRGHRAVALSRRLQRLQDPCIAISGSSLSHYLRHTITPRKGWLADLELVSRDGARRPLTPEGHRLVSYLSETGCIRDGFAIIEPDSDVLRDVIGTGHVIGEKPVDLSFYDALVADTYGGVGSHHSEMQVEEFLGRVEHVYGKVKLESFEQAEVSAVREALMAPLLAEGRIIGFERLLDEAVRRHPDRIHRLSSRTAAGAYISLRRRLAS